MTMTDTVRESMREAWDETRQMVTAVLVVGSLVYIPASFLVAGLWIRYVFGGRAMVASMVVLLPLYMFVLNLWFSYVGTDDTAPPLVP